MNNILTYEKYRRLVRLSESIYNKQYDNINEGFIDNIKEKMSTKTVDRVLADEIELGKQIEERIKETMSKLAKICDGLKTEDNNGSKFKKELNSIIEDINKTSFDTLSLLGDANVDFGGFRRSAILANIVNFGVIFSPIRNALILRRAYKYFIGLIKQSLRKDMVMLLINFDQFQNDILIQSLETEESVSRRSDIESARSEMETLYTQAISDVMGKKGKTKTMDKIMKVFKMKKDELDSMKRNKENNPVLDFMRNGMYNNTYKQTAETIKSLIGDDNQKLLDAHKNSIMKLADGGLSTYGEYIISAAEEKALKTSIAIHTNFLKISEVFKLSNQKQLVEMMQKAEKENQDEIEKMEKERKRAESEDFEKEKVDFIKEEGEKIIKDVKSFDDYDKLEGDVKGPKDYTLSKKELLVRYLQMDGVDIPDDSGLEIIIPCNKYEHNYDKSYLSYLDIIADKVSKCFNRKEEEVDEKKEIHREFSLNNMKDESGINKVVKKFLKEKAPDVYEVTKEATNALKIISDSVVKFDYEILLDKIKKSSESKFDKVDINDDTFDELKEAIDKIKKYKDNDYTLPDEVKEKSED